MICGQPTPRHQTPFGAFLVSQRLISPGELEAALICQSERNQRLGRLAFERNFLTFDKIQEIYEYQINHSRPFGESAVALGLLTQAEVDYLLDEQILHHKRLGEILVDLKVLTHESLEQLLNRYFHEIGETFSEKSTASN